MVGFAQKLHHLGGGRVFTPMPPAGYEFHLVVPSQVGPIFEKGLAPLFQSITPPNKP